MKQNSKRRLLLPLILTAVFVASSFAPILQIYIMTFDGYLVASINKVFLSDKPGQIFTANLLANLPPSLIFLFLVYKTEIKSIRVTAAIFLMAFMNAFILFLIGDLNEDSEPYFLIFLIASLISSSVLFFISIFRPSGDIEHVPKEDLQPN
ncbi:hypothetical protein [Spirosoma pollinicola]|uniref:Uncharacterized protein n=1 Tax=Spirosoma pollinicola TaxID=2057025 RepID=A0A2K8YZ59_9BACT|nr:hypothetical protein [Spirosoma pollinicola]AUD02913.1 hypothetical protein CWM47_14370 [Spirosoma pollinicola]